ncbi:MAG: hypothetical protein IJR02_06995 [Bacteroidaceae bacterium]|nr:hypothetical protein [Bacteroidaceae bacterium]
MNKMIHYRLFFFLLAILSETNFGLVGYAQQVMLADRITKNPVCYATVYDANGTVVGRSDIGGYINLQKGFEYHISHISYEPKSFVYNDDSIIFLSPSSYILSEVNVTAKRKKYYHCKVYFRSIEHVDSCLKYYMDGIREFYIDTKSKKVHCGNTETNYFMSKRKDIAQKKRSMMIGDRYMGIPFLDKNTLYEETMRDEKRILLSGIVYADSISIGSCEILSDKNEMLLSIDALWPKNSLVTNLFGYTQVLSQYNKTELYQYNDFDAPSLFNLKSSNSHRHLTLTHKKEDFVRDIDVEDMFYVVEYEYTDTKEFSSSELLREDYKKYSGMFPLTERIREQLVREDKPSRPSQGTEGRARYTWMRD